MEHPNQEGDTCIDWISQYCWTNGWNCLWRGHSVYQNRPLIPLCFEAWGPPKWQVQALYPLFAFMSSLALKHWGPPERQPAFLINPPFRRGGEPQGWQGFFSQFDHTWGIFDFDPRCEALRTGRSLRDKIFFLFFKDRP